MFSALRLCASVALLATLTAAVDIATPTNLVSGGTAVIEWAGATPDVFTIELCNTNLFHNAFAIANNVNSDTGRKEVAMPAVPPSGGYTFKFVNITDINQVYGESSEFSIAPPATESSASATSTGKAMSMSAGSATTTMSVSGSMSGVSTSTVYGPSASATSAPASGAATQNLLQGASTAAMCAGVLLLGLL